MVAQKVIDLIYQNKLNYKMHNTIIKLLFDKNPLTSYYDNYKYLMRSVKTSIINNTRGPKKQIIKI